jgi:hypothetical protein
MANFFYSVGYGVEGSLGHRRLPVRPLERGRQGALRFFPRSLEKNFTRRVQQYRAAWEGDRVELEAAISLTWRLAIQRGLCGRV